MQTVHIMTGLPGSGKTTEARRIMAASRGRIQRLNLDDTRAMLGGDWSREREEVAQEIQARALRAILDAGFDALVDNTHLTQRGPKRLKKAAHGDAVFKVHNLLHVPIETCVERDAQRSGSARVGEDVIRRLADNHRKARQSGWRLTDAWMNDGPVVAPYVPDLSRPSAVLCDIDGTLALMNGRSPYDWSRVGEDELNQQVASTLFAFRRTFMHKIILLSGRDGVCHEQTVQWLARKGVGYDALHMREAGDGRPDDVIKAELFDQHIRHQFSVRLVLEDRDQVVALWRKRLGLPTWQVNYGNF